MKSSAALRRVIKTKKSRKPKHFSKVSGENHSWAHCQNSLGVRLIKRTPISPQPEVVDSANLVWSMPWLILDRCCALFLLVKIWTSNLLQQRRKISQAFWCGVLANFHLSQCHNFLTLNLNTTKDRAEKWAKWTEVRLSCFFRKSVRLVSYRIATELLFLRQNTILNKTELVSFWSIVHSSTVYLKMPAESWLTQVFSRDYFIAKRFLHDDLNRHSASSLNSLFWIKH